MPDFGGSYLGEGAGLPPIARGWGRNIRKAKKKSKINNKKRQVVVYVSDNHSPLSLTGGGGGTQKIRVD